MRRPCTRWRRKTPMHNMSCGVYAHGSCCYCQGRPCMALSAMRSMSGGCACACSHLTLASHVCADHVVPAVVCQGGSVCTSRILFHVCADHVIPAILGRGGQVVKEIMDKVLPTSLSLPLSPSLPLSLSLTLSLSLPLTSHSLSLSLSRTSTTSFSHSYQYHVPAPLLQQHPTFYLHRKGFGNACRHNR